MPQTQPTNIHIIIMFLWSQYGKIKLVKEI